NLEPDRGVSGSDYYLRFRVDNTGGRTAKTCVGRLIEAIDSQGKVINDFSMDFCWGQHNQEHEPEPEDILPHDKQYLDIAKCSTTQPHIVQLRVASKNPQLPRGDYHPGFRLWTPLVPPPYSLKIA